MLWLEWAYKPWHRVDNVWLIWVGEGRQHLIYNLQSTPKTRAAEIWQQNGKWSGESKIVKMGVQSFCEPLPYSPDALNTPKCIIQALATFHWTLPYFPVPIYSPLSWAWSTALTSALYLFTHRPMKQEKMCFQDLIGDHYSRQNKKQLYLKYS